MKSLLQTTIFIFGTLLIAADLNAKTTFKKVFGGELVAQSCSIPPTSDDDDDYITAVAAFSRDDQKGAVQSFDMFEFENQVYLLTGAGPTVNGKDTLQLNLYKKAEGIKANKNGVNLPHFVKVGKKAIKTGIIGHGDGINVELYDNKLYLFYVEGWAGKSPNRSLEKKLGIRCDEIIIGDGKWSVKHHSALRLFPDFPGDESYGKIYDCHPAFSEDFFCIASTYNKDVLLDIPTGPLMPRSSVTATMSGNHKTDTEVFFIYNKKEVLDKMIKASRGSTLYQGDLNECRRATGAFTNGGSIGLNISKARAVTQTFELRWDERVNRVIILSAVVPREGRIPQINRIKLNVHNPGSKEAKGVQKIEKLCKDESTPKNCYYSKIKYASDGVETVEIRLGGPLKPGILSLELEGLKYIDGISGVPNGWYINFQIRKANKWRDRLYVVPERPIDIFYE